MWKVKLINSELISELQCQWDKLFNIPIDKFYYIFSNKKTLLFEGFESYICFKEVYKLSLGAKGQFTDTINILAKYNNEVCQISYNPIKGIPLQRKNVWGKEFTPLIWDAVKKEWTIGKARKTNRKLWKEGRKKEKAIVKFINTFED